MKDNKCHTTLEPSCTMCNSHKSLEPNPMEEVNTLYSILSGILLNGYIQGEIGDKLKVGVLDKAKEEIEKVFTPNSQAISKEEVEKLETYQVSTIPELLGKELIDKNKLT